MGSQALNKRISGLYVITPDEQDTAKLVRMVRLALQGGAHVLQYRNKVAGPEQRKVQAQALRELALEFSVPLIINDDAILAQKVDADGVHLGGEDGSVEVARAYLGNTKLIGVSCYNRIELAREAVRVGADYVAFGSFFHSAVKPGAVSAPLDLLRQAHDEIDAPLVAIGGITVSNSIKLLESGADALAVISSVFAAPDIAHAARQFSLLDYS